jgi:integrase
VARTRRKQRRRVKSAISVRAYARRWIEDRRARGVESVANDEAKLRLYVLPQLGRAKLTTGAIRPRHIRALVASLRRRPGVRGRALAPRTVRSIYGVVHRLFEDAVADELIDYSPCHLRRHELPAVIDRDPAWRATAIFTKAEIELLLSDSRIPEDRCVVYALAACGGLRAGEISALRWHHHDASAEPLSRLVVARSFSRLTHREKDVKTGRPRAVPVHPVLREVLTAWRDCGWTDLMGRAPCSDDLIVPSCADQNRRVRHGWKRFCEDLERLGLRRRRFHDLRRTFITLCLSDGARKDVLRWISHGASGDVMDLYTTLPWPILCDAISCLRLAPHVSLVHRQLSLFSEDNGQHLNGAGKKRVEKRVTYNRKKLYDEVWSEPAISVAKWYGISDVALAKMCRKLSVPLPGVGYWAKVAAGQSPPRRALPKLSSNAYDQVIVTYLVIGERRITRVKVEPEDPHR